MSTHPPEDDTAAPRDEASRSVFALAELLQRLPGGGWVAQDAAQMLLVQHALIESLQLKLREMAS